MRAVRCLLAMYLTSVALAPSAGGAGRRNDAPARYRDGVVLLAFVDGVPDARQRAIVAGAHAVDTGTIGVGVHVLHVRPGHVRRAMRLLRANSEVRYTEPDFVHHVDGGLPDDPSVGSQWAVQNVGQTVNGVTGTAGADERSLTAWSVTTGTRAVVVATLDTGVQYTHPDLVTNIWNNPGGIGGCAPGTHGYNVLANTCDPLDDDVAYGGHGTHVAGIIGAVGNDAAGVAGVNWTTSIMALKWVDGHDGAGSSSKLIAAMDWVVRAKQAGVNVRVVNDSATWPGTAFSQAVADEIDLLGANDILFVTAAGNTAQNNDSTPRYPCSYNRPNMICVAASDQNDRLWSSSNRGVSTVKLAAPGVNILSTLKSSNYGYVSGTSMASPQVCGTAALILSLGYQSVAGLRAIILNNVDPLPSLAGSVATGGRLDVCKAVPGCLTAPTATPANVTLPDVTGILQLGSIVGASTGTWSGRPATWTYQWYRCGGAVCVPIWGATAETYGALAAADVGSTLAVVVTASNALGSASVSSNVSAPVAAASSPFAITSTIHDGDTLAGAVKWQATPAKSVAFVQFWVDGALRQTVTASAYTYNKSTTGLLDTTTLSNGTHVLGLRALTVDNRTYGFSGATVTVTNRGNPPPTTTTSTSTTSTTASSTTTTTTTLGTNGSIALVQSAAVEGSGVASVSVAFPADNAAGNLIIAFVRMSTTSQTVAVTDTNGNVYADAVSQAQTSDGHQVHVFFAKNVAGGANAVTARFSAANNHPWLAVFEYRGASPTSPLDRTAHAQGTSGAPSSGATATTVASNELLFAALGVPNSYGGTAAAGGGFVLQRQDTGTSRAVTETGASGAVGAYAGTFGLSVSTNWSAVLATFVPASTPATTTSTSATTTTVPTTSSTTTSSTTASSTDTTATTTTSTTTSLTDTTATTSSTTSSTDTTATTTTTSTTSSSTSTSATTTTTSSPPTTSSTTTSFTTTSSTTTTTVLVATTTTTTTPPTSGVGTYQAGVSGPAGAANVDTNLRLDAASTNLGSDPNLYVGVTNGPTKVFRAILAFDLADVPAGATVTACRLTVNVTQRTSPTPQHIRRLCGEHWTDGDGRSETQATWSSWATGTGWTTPGAGAVGTCGSGADYTTAGEVAYAPPSGTGSFTFPDLTPLCQDAIDARGGWLRLRLSQDAETTQSNLIKFDSSDASTPANRPKLTVGWSLP